MSGVEVAKDGDTIQGGEQNDRSGGNLPKEIRHEGTGRKRYPVEWLKSIGPLITKEPEVRPEGRLALKAQWAQMKKQIPHEGGGGSGGPNRVFGGGPPPPRRQGIPSPAMDFNSSGGFTRGPVPGGGRHSYKTRDLPARPQTSQIIRRGNVVTARVPSMPPQAKLEPLPERGENAWRPADKEKEEEDTRKVKEIRAILNKITLQTFDRLYRQLIAITVNSDAQMANFAREVYEKAVLEPNFAGMYADLSKRLTIDGKTRYKGDLEFNKALLGICQMEFNGNGDDDIGRVKLPSDLDSQPEEDRVIIMMKAKRRLVGSMKFMGELFNHGVLRPKPFRTEILEKLLEVTKKRRDEDVAECLCKLIATSGAHAEAKLEKNSAEDAKGKMDRYFEEIVRFSQDMDLPSRIRFMFKDLIDIRAANWEQRTVQPQAKKISEIHEEAKREEEKKQAQMNNSRGGDMRGGGGRRYQSFSSQVPQSMTRMTSHLQPRTSSQPTNFLDNQARRLNASQSSTGTRVMMENVELKPAGRTGKWGMNRSTVNTDSSTPATGLKPILQTRPAPSTIVEPKPVPKRKDPEPALLGRDALDRRATNLLNEYIANDEKDKVAPYFSTIARPEHADAIELIVRYAIESKISVREKTPGMLLLLLEGEKPAVSADNFSKGISQVVQDLDDLEIDDPQAGTVIAKMVAPVLANLDMIEQFLPSIKSALEAVAPMRQVSFGVKLLSSYVAAKGDISEDQVKSLYVTMQMDLLSLAKEGDKGSGEEKLHRLLEGENLLHVLQA